MIFLKSILDNFSYFRGIWFLFNVNTHHHTCIRGLLENAIWFIWKDNLGRFQHHDLLPLDMKKNNYCRIHHLWTRQSVLNVHNIIVMAVTKTYLHWFITTLRWLLHSDALHQASACWGIVTPYCDICMGQNWLSKLFGRIILTNADLLSKLLSSLHLRAKVLTKLIHIICSEITIYELLPFYLGPMSQML